MSGLLSRARPVDDPVAGVGARFAGLEGYRGLAAVGVLVYHVYQYQEAAVAGSFGDSDSPVRIVLHGLDGLVGLFFVLSAFLLFLPYARAVLAPDAERPSARAFLVRRAARVLPLYLVAVLVVWASRNPDLPGDWGDLISHLTFSQVYDDRVIFATIGPAWSLAVEVQFYVLLGLLGAVLVPVSRRLGAVGRRVLLWSVIAVLGLGSLAWKLVAAYVLNTPGDAWHVWFGLPARLDAFAIGMALAVVVAAGHVNASAAATATMRWSGLAVVALAVVLRPDGATEHTWFHSVAAVGFGLVLAGSVVGPGGRWTSLLTWPPVAFAGVVSYSLYLWHEPLLLWLSHLGWMPAWGGPSGFAAGIAVLLPVALVVAWASYELIERPASALRGLVDRRGRSRDYYDGS